jgi:Cys-tRNA(Pro) deacylase
MVDTDPKVARVIAAGTEHEIEVRPVTFPAGTRTAGDAAAAIGCDVAQIVKSLIFSADGEPVLFYVAGDNRLDLVKAAAVAGVNMVEKMDADSVKQATGFSIGATPPFGHTTPLRIFMDQDLLAHDEVWAAAGRPDSVFALDPRVLAAAPNATVCNLKS